MLHLATISPTLLTQRHGRVTEEQFAELFRSVALRMNDEMPGLYARPLRRGTLKVLCILMLDAPTLQVALKRWIQFNRVLDDGSFFTFHRDAYEATIRINPYPNQTRSPRLLQELFMKLVHGLCSWSIGARIELQRIDFCFAQPDDAADYLFMFPGPARFEQAVTAMVFDSKYLDRPVRRRSGVELRDLLRRAPLDWLFVPPSAESVAQRVRDWIQPRLGEDCDITHAATYFGLSARTLVRRLGAEGSTFQDIKDRLRRDVAIERLSRSSEPLNSIASDLGFSSATAFHRAFHRAFRRWTGGTPGDYRCGR